MSRTKPALRVVPAAQVQLSLNVQGVLRDVQQAFYGLCVNAGKQVLAAMMEADRVAYPSQGYEMLFDAHKRSFAALGGVARRGMYDFVPGNKIVVLCPAPLCAQPA